MGRLRRKLDQHYETPDRSRAVIIEIPKGRYAPVFRPPITSAATAIPSSNRGIARRKWAAIVAVAACVVLMAGLRWRSSRGGIRSIAITRIADLSTGGPDRLFAEGLAVEITAELVASGMARVVPLAESTTRLRGQPPSTVAATLRADAVLEGSVQTEGSRRRISLTLLQGGIVPVWSHTFQRSTGPSLDIQREVARAVANHLRPLLPRGTRPFEPSMAARDLYWAGRACQYNDDLAGAAATFERLSRLEPGYALAYAALGEVLGAMETIAGGSDYSLAISAGLRAAEIDPHLAEAHVSLGVTRCRMLDWRGAEAEFKRAIAVDPSYGPARGEYARNVLMPMRRFREALTESRRSAELEPDSFYAHVRLGYALLLNGRHWEAVRALDTARLIAPKSLWPNRELARALLGRGQPDEAIRNLTADDPVLLAIAHYRAGRLAESEQWMGAAMAATARDPVQRAILLIGTGRIAAGLTLAESVSTRRSLLFPTLAFDPILEPLRKNPRFQAILLSARLPS